MKRFLTSSRGFTTPIMFAGFTLVGILAVVGVVNLFLNTNSSKTASTIQSNTSQQIAVDNDWILVKHAQSGQITPECIQLEGGSIDDWKKLTLDKDGYEFISGPSDKKTCENNKDIPSTFITIQPTPTTNPNIGTGPCSSDNCATITPNNTDKSPDITDNTPTVSIKFNVFPSTFGKNGIRNFYCLKTSLQECGEDDWNDELPKDQTFTVCGAGNKALKIKCDSDYWFNPGSVYRIFIAQGTSEKNIVSNGNTSVLTSSSFYVKHFYPKVVAPKAGSDSSLNMTALQKKTQGDISVTLTGRNLRGSYSKNPLDGNRSFKSNIYNDYFIQAVGLDNNYRSPDACVYIPPDGTGTGHVLLPLNTSSPLDATPLAPGNYVLKIIDGKGGNSDKDHPTCTQGDFTFYAIPFTIGADEPGTIGEAIPDPNGKETSLNLKPPPPATPICFGADKDKDGYCTGIPTALGFVIHAKPAQFVSDIFTIVLSIGGIAAILFFIQAGYRLMRSAGNKEGVAAAREQITAAIMGLLFIILSIAILEFIGINILHIPGFK